MFILVAGGIGPGSDGTSGGKLLCIGVSVGGVTGSDGNGESLLGASSDVGSVGSEKSVAETGWLTGSDGVGANEGDTSGVGLTGAVGGVVCSDPNLGRAGSDGGDGSLGVTGTLSDEGVGILKSSCIVLKRSLCLVDSNYTGNLKL
jgi:hypothetical protein